MRKVTILMILTVVFLLGCKKEDSISPVETPTTLADLKAADSFSWSTGKPIVLKITGLPTQILVKSTLTVSLANGSVLFSSLHQMNENLSLNLVVPSTEVKLVLKYGSQSYDVPVIDQKASFSFIPVITEN